MTPLEHEQTRKIIRLNLECAHLIAALKTIRDRSDDHDDAMTIARETLEELEAKEEIS